MLRFGCDSLADLPIRFVTASAGSPAKQGAEGGGFKNPEEVSTLALLQAIRERVDVPLTAAGGIFDGAAWRPRSLGAEGVQMGTRFVASVESPVHDHFKQAIVAAEATGTWALNKQSTACIQALKTQRTQAIFEAGLMPADAFAGIQPVYFGGDMEAAPALAGQSVGSIHEVLTAQQIFDATAAEFDAITARLGALGAGRAFG